MIICKPDYNKEKVMEFIEDNINMVEKSVKEVFLEAKKNKPDRDFYYYRF